MFHHDADLGKMYRDAVAKRAEIRKSTSEPHKLTSSDIILQESGECVLIRNPELALNLKAAIESLGCVEGLGEKS